MATQADVRRIALALAGTEEALDRFAFSVEFKGKQKGYAWVWLERVTPKGARVPNPTVLAVRVANLGVKDLILSSDTKAFFTEPHYNGYPAVLVRLAKVRVPALRLLLEDAWRCVAAPPPKASKPKASKAAAPKAPSERRTAREAGAPRASTAQKTKRP